MRLLVFIMSGWILLSASSSNTVKPAFGIQVTIGANSQLTTFVCYIDNGTTLTQKKIVDRESFFKIVTGKWPSVFNPQRKNYFEENNVAIDIVKDSVTFKDVFVCPAIDSLWKLRFSTYPFVDNAGAGWSNKYFKPSPGQEKYLFDTYNVRQVDTDYFLGDNLWKILKDVTDKDWIENYKSIH